VTDTAEYRRFLDWIGDKPISVCLILAARAALRAIPAIAPATVNNYHDTKAITLAIFRACAVSWICVAGNNTSGASRAANGANVAALQSRRKISVGNGKSSEAESHNFHQAAFAAERAALIAIRVTEDSEGMAQKNRFAEKDAGTAVNAAAEAMPVGLWREVTHDFSAIDNGVSVAELARRSLYSTGLTDPSGSAIGETAFGEESDEDLFPWYSLKQTLESRNEDWDIWTNWYEDRLFGRAQNPAFEKALLTLTEEEWKQEPTTVNARLKGLMEENLAQDELMGIFGAAQTSADMAGAIVVPASDRLVSVRDNQEPFDQLEKSLDEIRDEFARNHNYLRKNFDDFDRFEEASIQLRRQLRSGLVNLNFLLDSILPLMRKLSDFCKYASIIGGSLWIASGKGITAIEKIIAAAGG